jgi:hypothetical protein
MRQFLHTTLFSVACFLLYAQPSFEIASMADVRNNYTEKTIYYKLAGNILPIKIQQYGTNDELIFVSLHDDEYTSVEATKRILETTGGLLIEIENNLQRNIRFKLGNYFYTIDPNRIFSKNGIKGSLEEFGKSSGKAISEVEKLGKRILQLIPDDAKCVIALHNNTSDLYSVTEYAAGNKRSSDSKKVYINNEQDTDDFFLTTDKHLYEKLADKGFNTILQDNKKSADDGSLSVYCGKKNIRYVNCETEHGKTEQYFEMIKHLIAVLPKK